MSKLKTTSVIIAAAIIVAACVVTILELTNTTHWFHAKPANQTANNSNQQQTGSDNSKTKPNSSNKSSSGDNNTSVPPSNDQKPPTAASPNKKLLAPSDNSTFANQYDVTLGQQLSSTCITNSGVYCQMVFTKGNISKSLPKKMTDASGSVSWNWHPSDIGLTPGVWHIKAVSSYQGQSKSTSADPLTLEVKS